MTHHSGKISPQFFVTAPQPCPYLEGRSERKLFTTLRTPDAAQLNDLLSLRGFRRSQGVVYRPSCLGCSACLSSRIPVADFRPGRTHRRILRRNADVARHAAAAVATDEQYTLFRRYLNSRHADGGMAEMDVYEFAAMIEETPVRTRVIEYTIRDEHDRERLIAACLTDVLEDGLSMVYSFYDPDMPRRSLGAFMILDHVEIARQAGLPYVYLGYWVPGSEKMDYKARFRPFEIYQREAWRRVEDPAEVSVEEDQVLSVDPVADQVARLIGG
ncbi:arginyltransferase [Oceanicella actignis]|uniref:Aspartate/glutamate leucyltransferase n=1 Tax=Oceanicella actignis TaxID=1189325 RepID=A0A1M7TZD4_9RHOB|nr:arginyltransferase [Oceanicella actignis]TYO85072.1 arginine-tRNA-protein transferase [Oceanicella actignis]SET82984.1 arginine-tRNA-protein transferase [Oceanicella actignis]SHN76033.1 arginine-tRNA-protein transferase [Oceanicella actignis]